MDTNSGYRVNDDGSVTRIDSSTNSCQGNNNSGGGSSNNNGCVWWTIVAIIAVLIIVFSNINSSDQTDVSDSVDSVEIDNPIVVEETDAVATVELDDDPPEATYLSVSNDEIYIDADGESTEIEVSTDGEWYIDVDVAGWGHLTKYSNSLTLRIDPNPSSSSRTDYFIIKSGDYTKRINIKQYGNTTPSGDITRVWVDHNVYYNGAKGMKIHASYDVVNMKDKNVYMYTYFYYGDNSTPLKNPYGNHLSMSSSGLAPYESTTFNDTWHFIPYTNLNMQPGYGSIDLSFDVVIKDGNGTQLDRDENNRFTLNEN